MSVINSTMSQFKLSPNDIDLKAREVERTLEPLIKQITLITKSDASTSKRGQLMKAEDLIKELIESIDYFIVHGTDIANDYPDYRNELVNAIKDIRITGDLMIVKSKEFVANPFSSTARGMMVQTARDLLGAVTRLLAIADMIDVQLILKSINMVERDLESIQNATNQRDLQRCLENYNKNASNLLSLSGQRVNNVNDLIVRDELASCRATLKISKLMLLTSSKSRVQFGEILEARRNNDLAVKGVCAAMDKIRDISTNKVTSEQLKHKYDKAISLSDGFDELDKQLMETNAIRFNESSVRVNLESQINKLVNSIAQLADLNNGDGNRKGKIIDQCNALKQALQDLLDLQKNKYLSGDRDLVAIKANEMTENTRKLKQQLRKLVADHVVTCFTEAYRPLEELINAARAGDSKRVDECIQRFLAHSRNISKVSSIACAMSNDPEGISLVRLLDGRVQELSPQVTNAAKILVAKPMSDVAQDNMNVYKDEWQKAVKFLIDAIDDVININYFLSASESHILEDINRCIDALNAKDANTFEYYSNAIKSKIARICHVVSLEMDNYEPCNYTNGVLESVSKLKNQTMISFSQSVHNNANALRAKPLGEVDENDFIDKARQVHEGIRKIRNAVLFTGDYESSDSEGEDEDENEKIEVEVEDDYDDDSFNIPHPVANPESPTKQEENMISEILKHWQTFREDKRNFDREVLKWDDKGNDIISLAKQMCAIMTDMADFSRGKGPLKTTMDVINAAKKISECGSKLNKLAKNIADECPESQSKRDLEAYMNQIPLFCNQLNIAGKVKESVIDISGAPTIASLDSATSLIIASKNLMNCVLSVVKESYVASTKYYGKGEGAKKPIEWKMKAPEKKPLFVKTKTQDLNLRKQILKRK